MQRDYILRLIEQAGTALRRLIARLEGGARHAELMADLQRTAQLGGLDIDLLRMCDAQGLLHVVAPTGEPDPSRTWLAAETLLVDARAARAEGNLDHAREGFAKAASLFRLLEPTWVLPSGFPEATDRVAEIETHLAEIAAAVGK